MLFFALPFHGCQSSIDKKAAFSKSAVPCLFKVNNIQAKKGQKTPSNNVCRVLRGFVDKFASKDSCFLSGGCFDFALPLR